MLPALDENETAKIEIYAVEDKIPRVYPRMHEPATLLPRVYDLVKNVSTLRFVQSGTAGMPGGICCGIRNEIVFISVNHLPMFLSGID